LVWVCESVERVRGMNKRENRSVRVNGGWVLVLWFALPHELDRWPDLLGHKSSTNDISNLCMGCSERMICRFVSRQSTIWSDYFLSV
jgi:hypothetical protein